MLDDSVRSCFIQAQVLPLEWPGLRSLDLFKVLFYPRKFLEDRMVFRSDAIQS